jgi:hypothetical protein
MRAPVVGDMGLSITEDWEDANDRDGKSTILLAVHVR